MAINKVNTTDDEKDYNFLKNQSSIIRTVSTNNITINGVNVIVAKPKVGDIMCVTRYKNDNDVLLPAEEQKVVWIDGLSIEPLQLSIELEPVGICVAINGNKALVRYKKEFTNIKWSAGERWEIKYDSIVKAYNTNYVLQITLNNVQNDNKFTFTSAAQNNIYARREFVEQLNDWFLANNTNYSAELVKLDTDEPANDESDIKDGNSYRNRIIINARFTKNTWNHIKFDNFVTKVELINSSKKLNTKREIGNHIKAIGWCYKKNGFAYSTPFCCKAFSYDYLQTFGNAPTTNMTTINIAPGGRNSEYPVCEDAFTNNENCLILRKTFATYDEYLDSMMVKYPCNAGGSVAEFPSGKENTYKLADCTFLNNIIGVQEHLYPAATKAASIHVNGPKLTAGNWWLPSTAELVQMMYGITYGTTFWDSKPDIINRVITKFTSINNSGWSELSARANRWSSSKYNEDIAYGYSGSRGHLPGHFFYTSTIVSPVTIYEF